MEGCLAAAWPVPCPPLSRGSIRFVFRCPPPKPPFCLLLHPHPRPPPALLLWLSGTLPSELGQLQRLRVLALDANFFQGTIGNWIGNLRDLEVLTLGANGGINPPEPGSAEGEEGLPGFVGSIPASLASLTKLVELNLQARPGGGGVWGRGGDVCVPAF